MPHCARLGAATGENQLHQEACLLYTSYDDVCLYYGSSTYDRAEMARLLDDLIEDAQALGIETKSPEEVDRLLSLWQCEDATCAER